MILSGLIAGFSSMATSLTVLYGLNTLRPSPSMYGILFVAMGIGGLVGSAMGVTMWNVLSMSLRQAMIPAELLGRVLGAYRVVLWGGIPLGALIGGALADRASVSAVFLVSGLAQLVVVVMIHRLIHRHRRMVVDSGQDRAQAM